MKGKEGFLESSVCPTSPDPLSSLLYPALCSGALTRVVFLWISFGLGRGDGQLEIRRREG